ncbi:hypothetical protein [Hymenobacter properus]|uniref:Uncharacterized protein n=1 Tax=Hymenobacter properus TaxID=2791026 RepID=A0A931FIS8_9BACT|nr:hypothetical protein [Hymenobacter properus]MBF9141118.1 hypothetical protein [Hymenobacter properus]MBR7719927.1 hypothetical protein [Microvirga sp. SRT04]
MRKIFLASLLVFGTQVAHSQAVEPGYLVLQRGDTLRGEVENAFWEEPPATVRFRAAASAPWESYSSESLASLYVSSGRLWRRETLPLDRAAQTKVDLLSYDVVRRQTPESVLAEVLVLGPASLRGLTLNGTRHFFVQRPGQPFLELAARNYLVNKEGATRVADANDFKSQLLRYFGDCEALTRQLDNTPFTAAGLTGLVQAYNQHCSEARRAGQEIAVRGPEVRPALALRVGALAGLRFNSVRLDGQGQAGAVLHGLNADARLHPQLGLYADVVNGRRRLALHSAVMASRFGRSEPASFGGTAGSYQWSGTVVGLQLGLRGFWPVGPRTQVLAGVGYELNTFWDGFSDYHYGPEQSGFIYQFWGTALPYLEAGLSHQRFAFTLLGRIYDHEAVTLAYSTPIGRAETTYTYTPGA